MPRLEVAQSLKLMREVVRLHRLHPETIVTGRSRAQSLNQMQEVEPLRQPQPRCQPQPRRQPQPRPRPEAIATGRVPAVARRSPSRGLWQGLALSLNLLQLVQRAQHRPQRAQHRPQHQPAIATGRSRAK